MWKLGETALFYAVTVYEQKKVKTISIMMPDNFCQITLHPADSLQKHYWKRIILEDLFKHYSGAIVHRYSSK